MPEVLQGDSAAGLRHATAQDRLQAFKRWILGVPGIERSGYVESVNDPVRSATVLLWHGPADPMQHLLVHEARRRGITVTVSQRRFDYSDIDRATRRIAAQARAGVWRGLRITGISGMSAGHDGLVVGVRPVAEQRFARRAVGSVAGVPVRVEPRPQVTPWATRQSGRAPFAAGGLMVSDHGACSSGFSVHWQGKSRVTSARHCEGRFRSPGRPSAKYGGHIAWSEDGAAAVFSARGSARMFTGGLRSVRRVRVAGLRDLSLGDRVCTGGANSGSHCGLVVTDMYVWMQDQFGGFHTIRADAPGGRPAAAPGDSGGPVYVKSSSGKHRAAGMIQGGPDPRSAGTGQVVRCATNYRTRCGTFVLFTSMRTIVNALPGSKLARG